MLTGAAPFVRRVAKLAHSAAASPAELHPQTANFDHWSMGHQAAPGARDTKTQTCMNLSKFIARGEIFCASDQEAAWREGRCESGRF